MLNKRYKYLQIAFNRSFEEVRSMINQLPTSDRIIIEAGTPFIKRYGMDGISSIKSWWGQKNAGNTYIVADLKVMDRGATEVSLVAQAGASAATCLGLAPTETIDEFIKNCEKAGIDSMLDMMNVKFPFEVLQKLKNIPNIVVLHRGADENVNNREKILPLDQIRRIKGAYNNIIISVAGGETTREVMRTFFNDSNIAVVWRSFYENPQNATRLAEDFLKLTR